MVSSDEESGPSLTDKARRALFGPPREFRDPSVFHKISLIPLLAWIGLGADGLSSSSYGPEEAFRALGQHTYIALLLAAATAFTVFTISYAYTRIIEHFPHGGGGYIVATHMLGKRAGVISGSALLVDYVLTVTVSVASCVDAIFSYLPPEFRAHKVVAACILLLALLVLNIRGVKESVTILAPIFIAFVAMHALMLFDGVITHADRFGPMVNGFHSGLSRDVATIGWVGVLALLLRAYSLGGGTYTGIEAVSNGLQILREPRVQNGKRTMLYMATSLAFTAGMLLVCYLLLDVHPAAGRTLNAVLADALFADWPLGGALAAVTIFSEGALLLVAAQAGLVDGPRVMANMALDSWFPRRFSAVSERLTMHNGIVVMVAAAMVLMIHTRGSVSALIVLYSINVFLTFSLTELGMARYYLRQRSRERRWARRLAVHAVGLTLCLTILVITTAEKFSQGGWLTLVITTTVVGGCHLIKRHYDRVRRTIAKLDEVFIDLPVTGEPNTARPNPGDQTAIQLVSGYNSFGIHTFLSVVRNFPGLYRNFIFVSIAVVDSDALKDANEIARLEGSVRRDLERYVELARKLGFAADSRMAAATDVVESAVATCKEVAKEFPRSTVFAGQITFRVQRLFQRLLHNETSFAIQRQLHWSGITTVIMPIRVTL